MQLRPAQEAILQYERGRMAVSAVPGSGKTFTLSLLAAQLIAGGSFDPERQQILIVTYLNASVDTFKARIRKRLIEMERLPAGFDVRTLHSLALEIVRVASSGNEESLPVVLDETQANLYLNQAVDGWIEANRSLWHQFLQDDSPQLRARWRTITENAAKSFIRTAKNERYKPEQINGKLHAAAAESALAGQELTWMLAGIYDRYQTILIRQSALDFDDLIWRATDLLENRADLVEILRQRWPYVLEDEAQDSVPLQEVLLAALTGPEGNWVRVGDPNQAITSTFTAAHPRFFNAFMDQPDVQSRPLPNSGRSAPLIIGAANAIVHWVCDHHPILEVQQTTFRRQEILPTPPGDAQPNPPDSEANIAIKVYRHREEEELPGVARLAVEYTKRHPEHTLAILVPTNNLGHQLAEHLDGLEANYDNLLRGGGRERQIAAALHAMLALLANPLDTRALIEAYAALHEMGHPALGPQRPILNDEPDPELERFYTVLRSTHSPERLLFPREDEDPLAALPTGVATEEDIARLEPFLTFLRHLFTLRTLPVDDLTLAMGDELFAWGGVHEADLALAYQMANIMRRWRDQQPEWRLPDLAAQLADVARGRRSLPLSGPNDLGYEPQPGRITLSTQHSAKGLEWDAVFLVGVDGNWIPGSLEAYFQGDEAFLGGDPNAEAVAQLRYLMAGEAGIFPERTATETAHIEIICERLRLLYVGITRARRFLQLSRSRATRRYNKEQTSEPATVMGVIYQYLQANRD
jgi:DNA helicase-2/ATP-dependent DNA helicase PcrA